MKWLLLIISGVIFQQHLTIIKLEVMNHYLDNLIGSMDKTSQMKDKAFTEMETKYLDWKNQNNVLKIKFGGVDSKEYREYLSKLVRIKRNNRISSISD